MLLTTTGDAYVAAVDGTKVMVRLTFAAGALTAEVDGARSKVTVVRRGDERVLFRDGRMRRVFVAHSETTSTSDDRQGGHLRAPMSGTIIDVLVKRGDVVPRDAPLLILEAMKMEHTISATHAGTVVSVHFAKGDQVAEGATLIDMDAVAPSA